MIEKVINGILSGVRFVSTPIFLFHSTFCAIPKILRNNIHNVGPENFYRIMKWISLRYDIVSIDDLFHLKNVRRKAAVTFDDGYLSVIEEAIPILIDLKIPSTIFLNGCNLENEIFWRDKIRYLINRKLVSKFLDFLNQVDGIKISFDKETFYRSSKMPFVNSKWLDDKIDKFLSYINADTVSDLPKYCINNSNQIYHHPLVSYGNHTYHHYVLSSLTEKQQKIEINLNQKMLHKVSNNVSQVFSVPFGGLMHINQHTFNILKEENYKGLLFSNNIANYKLRKYSDRFKIGDRLMVPDSIDQFKKQVLKGYIRSFLK